MCDTDAKTVGGHIEPAPVAIDGGDTASGAATGLAAVSAGSASSPASDKPEDSIVTWLSLENRRLTCENANPRLEQALLWTDFCLYGDAELALYMMPSERWPEDRTLIDFVRLVQRAKGSGWISSTLHETNFRPGPRTLAEALGACGFGFTKFKKSLAGGELSEARRFLYEECKGSFWNFWLPRGQEDAPVVETITLRECGNFRTQALRTRRFLFMLCFATS